MDKYSLYKEAIWYLARFENHFNFFKFYNTKNDNLDLELLKIIIYCSHLEYSRNISIGNFSHWREVDNLLSKIVSKEISSTKLDSLIDDYIYITLIEREHINYIYELLKPPLNAYIGCIYFLSRYLNPDLYKYIDDSSIRAVCKNNIKLKENGDFLILDHITNMLYKSNSVSNEGLEIIQFYNTLS